MDCNLRKVFFFNLLGVALLCFGSVARAYVPLNNADADVVIYWGGAITPPFAQERTIAAVCDTDPHLLYVLAGGATNPDRPANDWAVACLTAAAGVTRTGLPNNLRVLVIKRDRDGSGAGIAPVELAIGISFLTLFGNCTTIPIPGLLGAPTIPNPDGGSVPLRGCTATYTTNARAEMGTSDIEPDKFFGRHTPLVDGVSRPYVYMSGMEFASPSPVPLVAETFNTPVTLALFLTLQAEQFPIVNICHPEHPDFNLLTANPFDRADATNGSSEACMPSLTRQELASILTGRIVSWNRLVEADGSSIDARPGFPAFGTLPVQICRRTDGSGVQAVFDALILGFPCDTGSIDIVGARQGNATTVIANSGSSDVDDCLHSFNSSSTNPYAIGLLNVERNTALDRGWRYIKVDGVAPTLRNVHAGDYWLWAQQSCQLRYDPLSYNPSVGAFDTVANKGLLFNSLCGVTAVNGLNNASLVTHTWGVSGSLFTPTASILYDNVLDVAPASVDGDGVRPVNALTREIATNEVNICAPAMKSSAGANGGRGITVAPNPSWTPED